MQLKPAKFELLNNQICENIHKKALEILENPGFKVHSPDICNILKI